MNKLSHNDFLKLYYSDDDFDYSNLPVDQRKGEAKECVLCHKMFYPSGRNWHKQRYCKRSHYVNCVICGKPVLQVEPTEKPKGIRVSCKGECAKKFRAQQTFASIKDKYGYDNVSQVPELKEKISAGIRAKSEETAKKVQATMKERYGGMGTASPILRKKIEATMKERYGVKYSSERSTAFKQLKHREFNVIHPVAKDDLISKFADKLYSSGITNVRTNFSIGSVTYDIVLLSRKIIVQLNLSATSPSHPNYYLDLSASAEGSGFRCIHVFDWDNWEDIINQVKCTERIYARNCNVYNIDPKQIDEFIAINHIQGNAKGAKFACALLYEGEVVSVMTFGKPRYNKNYEWELLRYCTDSKYRVVGGASKLFNHFLKQCKPQSVLSYCDRAKFSGEVYEAIGMKLHHITAPSKVWSKGSEYITDNLLRQRGFDQLFGTNYGKGTSNEELMIQNGWRSVYDCGQKVFEWSKNQDF